VSLTEAPTLLHSELRWWVFSDDAVTETSNCPAGRLRSFGRHAGVLFSGLRSKSHRFVVLDDIWPSGATYGSGLCILGGTVGLRVKSQRLVVSPTNGASVCARPESGLQLALGAVRPRNNTTKCTSHYTCTFIVIIRIFKVA